MKKEQKGIKLYDYEEAPPRRQRDQQAAMIMECSATGMVTRRWNGGCKAQGSAPQALLNYKFIF
jgi:hypothetical protein